MPKVFTSDKQKIGEMGENIAVRFLMKHGFLIKDRNYTKKWGEIDIVAQKDHKLYFVEVKSVSHVTDTVNNYRPEDNMHPWKLKRLSRTIQTYLLSKNLDDMDWQVDLLVVYLCQKEKKARVKVVSDIIL
jgi:putative endonuclease